MKKILAVILAAIMAVAVTGCGKAVDNSQNNTGNELKKVDYSYGLTEDGYYEGVDLSQLVTLPENYKEMEFAQNDVTPSEKDWEAYRSHVASSVGIKQEMVDAVAEDGSYVTIDFVGTVDGKNFTGGSAENVDLQIGYGQYLEEFENSIIGHKAGEEFTVDVEFPTDYGITTDTEGNELDLGEKTATFSITVKSINEFALSDENVADYFSLYNEDKADEEKILTIEKMKAAFMEEYSNSLLQNRVLENLMENTEIAEIPQSVIDAFVHVEMELVEYNAASAGLSAETLVQANNFESLAAYEEYVTENSVSAIKEQLVLLAVAEKENIQYDEATCRSAFQGEPSELVEMYGQGYVSQNVICYKVIDVLTNAAIIN